MSQLSDLVVQHRRLLLSVAIRHYKDVELAKDLVQDFFIRMTSKNVVIDATRGPREFLIVSFKRFCAQQSQYRWAKKRAGPSVEFNATKNGGSAELKRPITDFKNHVLKSLNKDAAQLKLKNLAHLIEGNSPLFVAKTEKQGINFTKRFMNAIKIELKQFTKDY